MIPDAFPLLFCIAIVQEPIVPDAYPLMFYTILIGVFLAVFAWVALDIRKMFRRPKEPKAFPWPEDENT